MRESLGSGHMSLSRFVATGCGVLLLACGGEDFSAAKSDASPGGGGTGGDLDGSSTGGASSGGTSTGGTSTGGTSSGGASSGGASTGGTSSGGAAGVDAGTGGSGGAAGVDAGTGGSGGSVIQPQVPYGTGPCPQQQPMPASGCSEHMHCCWGYGAVKPLTCTGASWVENQNGLCCPLAAPTLGTPCDTLGALTCCYGNLAYKCQTIWTATQCSS